MLPVNEANRTKVNEEDGRREAVLLIYAAERASVSPLVEQSAHVEYVSYPPLTVCSSVTRDILESTQLAATSHHSAVNNSLHNVTLKLSTASDIVHHDSN